jgi:predicted flap endonuclease-1-like 5' DNA nuclease
MSTTDTGGHQVHKGDLDKLKGIGARYREILEEVGVASIKELRHRNAASLKAMIEKRHGAVVGLSEHQMQTWIDEAKAFTESEPA